MLKFDWMRKILHVRILHIPSDVCTIYYNPFYLINTKLDAEFVPKMYNI